MGRIKKFSKLWKPKKHITTNKKPPKPTQSPSRIEKCLNFLFKQSVISSYRDCNMKNTQTAIGNWKKLYIIRFSVIVRKQSVRIALKFLACPVGSTPTRISF